MTPLKRRKHPRIPAKDVVAHIQAAERLITGCPVENLSLGGAFLLTPQRFPVGEPITLDLHRSGMRSPLSLTGLIVAAEEEPSGLRVQFDPMRGDVEARLGQLLGALGLADPYQDESMKPPPPPLLGDLLDDEPLTSFPAGPVAPIVAPLAALPPPPASAPAEATDTSRLMLQIRGLLMELGETQQRLESSEREREGLAGELSLAREQAARAEDLSEELELARSALRSREEQLAQLRRRLAELGEPG